MDFSPSKLLGKNSTFQASLHYLVYPVPYDASSPSELEKICLPASNPLPAMSLVDILAPRQGIAYIFDPHQFDATKTDPKDRNIIKKKLLNSLIEKASHEGGQVLVSNGGDGWGRQKIFKYYTLACSRNRKCHKKPMERADTKNESLQLSARHMSQKYWLQWFLRLLQKWVYTFMKSNGGVESEEEYQVSKSLLLAFVNSDTLKKYLTPDGILAVKGYLENSIFTYEDSFVSYRRMHLHNKEREDNCGHEGTNYARKYMDDHVLPTDSIMTATEKLASYDDLVMHERKQMCLNEFKKTKLHTKRWKHLTTYYVGIVKQEELLAEKSQYTWEYDKDTSSIYVMAPYKDEEGNELPDELPDDSLQELFESDSHSHDEVSGDSTKHTLKEISAMKSNDLMLNMNESEKSEVQTLLKESLGAVARFRRSRKVEIQLKENQKSLFESLKLKEFSYKNIHVTCYSSYSYLTSRENDLSAEEKLHLDHLLKEACEDPVAVNLQCQERTSPTDTYSTILSELEKMNLQKSRVHFSPKKCFFQSAQDRVLNYSSSAVRAAMNSLQNVDNLHLQVEYSQNDEAFGSTDLNKEFELGLSQPNTDETNPKFLKTELQKEFFELLNQIGSRDVNSMKILAKHLRNANEEIVQHNLSQQSLHIDNNRTYFPSGSFGDKSKNKISKKYK